MQCVFFVLSFALARNSYERIERELYLANTAKTIRIISINERIVPYATHAPSNKSYARTSRTIVQH